MKNGNRIYYNVNHQSLRGIEAEMEFIHKGIENTIGQSSQPYRIIIYGAGMYGKLTYDLVMQHKNLSIVGWVDKNYLNIQADEFPIRIQNPDIICELEYDYIIITAVTQKIIEDICNTISKYNRTQNHIILIDKNEFDKKDVQYLLENQFCQSAIKEWKDYIYLRDKYDQYIERKEPTIGKDSGYLFLLWLQGWDNAPLIVKKCRQSVEKYVTNRKIIYLNEKNCMNYIEIPNDIQELHKKGIICNAHYSDLIRLELLKNWGGLWLDATVFLSGELYSYITDQSLFTYQLPKFYARSISNWLMYAHSNHIIIEETLHLLYTYWRTEMKCVNYYVMHYLFRTVTNIYYQEWSKVPFFTNLTSTILASELDSMYNEKRLKEIMNMTHIHKLNHRINSITPNTILEYI